METGRGKQSYFVFLWHFHEWKGNGWRTWIMSSLRDLLFHLSAVKSKLLFIAEDRKQAMCFSFCVLHRSVHETRCSFCLSLGRANTDITDNTSQAPPGSTWLESPEYLEFLDGGHKYSAINFLSFCQCENTDFKIRKIIFSKFSVKVC